MFQATRRHFKAASGLAFALALIVAALLACALQSAFSVAAAQAEAPALVSFGNFSSGVTEPVGVAVNQSNGDVFVAGIQFTASENGKDIGKLDGSGKLLKPSPFGEGTGKYSGVAVNPTNGDVYVVESIINEEFTAYSQAVVTYDPNTGARLSSFPLPGSASFGFIGLMEVQIATDSAGDVYVPITPDNEVLKYSSTGALLQTFSGSGAGALHGPTGVAVSASGDVWVADHADKRIEELSQAGAFIGEIESEGVQALALDTHGDVFATVSNSADFCGSLTPPCTHLVEYNSAGAQIADIGAGEIAAGGTSSFLQSAKFSTPAVNEATGRVYVTDPSRPAVENQNLVWAFGPPFAPVVGSELAAEVGTSEVKLGALVNPGGIGTSYHFEYGTTIAYGQTTPFPDGNVRQGVTSHTVWAAASGLQPGTTYHYRVVAINELGTVAGADQTFTTETSAQASCPNEQFRGGFSASLPDCRAYELVTPPTKTSTQPDPFESRFLFENHAASEGNRFAYFSIDILPGALTGGQNYLATRGADGWSSEDVIPLQSYTSIECPGGSHINEADEMLAYSTDLSLGVLDDGYGERRAGGKQVEKVGGCGAEPVEVVPGEPRGYENLLLRDNATGAYRLVNLTPPGIAPADAHLQGASSDLNHVVFSEQAQLTAGAPGGVEDLYEWSGGVVRLVTVLPNGTPVAGSLATTPQRAARAHVVSTDGSHIFFTAGNRLYVRMNGSSTVQVDASQAGGSGGGGKFVGASADGSQVLFTDDASAGLTGDTLPGSGTNLYRYADGQLTDLTPQSAAEVVEVGAISEDGSYVYFVADGNLAAGATQGQPNLYLSHDGMTTFIATVSGEGEVPMEFDGAPPRGLQVSANGIFLAFVSKRSLTGYNNIQAGSGACDEGGPEAQAACELVGGCSAGTECTEIFLYNAASGQLACVSCNPSGEAPTAGATIEASVGEPHRYVSDSGRVFFETLEALVPLDTNGQTDVYEYESGQPHLISSGTSSSGSLFVDASDNDNDVFFLTRQKLVPRDTQEEARNVYDARVGGGFFEPSSPPACTTAESCRTASSPQPSIFGAPSSATFSGAGNLAPATAEPAVKPKAKPAKCRPGFAKKKGKCAKRRGRHRQAKKRPARKANNDRRAKS